MEAAARLPSASACSNSSTASANRPSLCSSMPCIFTASAWSGWRASAQRSHCHAPARSRSAARNWHQAICVSTCDGFSAKAVRRCASAPAGRLRSRSELRQVYPARNQIRTQLNGSQQRCLGYDLPPLISQQTAQIHPRRGKIRTPRQRPAIAGFSFFQSSHPGQHKSGCKVGLWKRDCRASVRL